MEGTGCEGNNHLVGTSLLRLTWGWAACIVLALLPHHQKEAFKHQPLMGRLGGSVG